MEILLWLVPAAGVTLIAMLWVSWLGRDGRGEVDRDVAVARLAEAMERGRAPKRAAPGTIAVVERDRSTGVAVRPSRAPRQVPPPPRPPTPGGEPGTGSQTRRAS